MSGFGLYQSCGNMWSVGRVSVFGLRWWEVGRGLDQGMEKGWIVLCLRESGFCIYGRSMYLYTVLGG